MQSKKRKHEQTTNNSNGKGNGSNSNNNKNKNPKLNGEYGEKNTTNNANKGPKSSLANNNFGGTQEKPKDQHRKVENKNPTSNIKHQQSGGKRTVKGKLKAKEPLSQQPVKPQSSSTKFFELLERDGLVSGHGVTEDGDERELKALRKKLGLKGNKLSGDFIADGLDCIYYVSPPPLSILPFLLSSRRLSLHQYASLIFRPSYWTWNGHTSEKQG